MTVRTLQRAFDALPTMDGAGVRLRRGLGQAPGIRLDPFLMLDHFSSDDPDDYIAGFPPHPHRGFETVTYMVDGHFRHEDHLGHVGELKSGGVQWMTAGRGIIHSEMPRQEAGRVRGFQLWLNLPAREKMKPASYRNIEAPEIPVVELDGGGRVKVIAGSFEGARTGSSGAVPGPIRGGATDPLIFDVTLAADERFAHPLPAGRNAFLYVFEGSVVVGPAVDARELGEHRSGILSEGTTLEVAGGNAGGRFLLLAGSPLNEPVVQYGPFVMNTREEIEQAIRDYQSGVLAQAA